jgi:hypothetical protein
MAEPRLSAHAEIFKQLSLDCQQLKLILRLLEELIFRALVRGRELGDGRLLILHEQLEVLALRAQRITDDLEECLCGVTE